MNEINSILFLLFFTTVLNLNGQKLDSLNVKLEIDKLEYKQDESVKLSIINISKDTLYLYFPQYTSQSLKLKMNENNEWKFQNISQASGGLYSFETLLLSSDTINFLWHQNVIVFNPSFTRLKAVKGVYRFELEFWTSYEGKPSELKPIGFLSTQSEDYYISFSKQFTIK